MAAAAASPRKSSAGPAGRPKRKRGGRAPAANEKRSASGRENGSASSKPRATSATRPASSTVSAKIDTQSSDGQAGTTPVVLSRPRLGFRPTRLLKAAGTRPEPAVSVPSATSTSPAATATADPELDPPGT